MLRVAANDASTACLLDQYLLHLPPSTRYRLALASGAAKARRRPNRNETRPTVPPTFELGRLAPTTAHRGKRRPALSTASLQAMPFQPAACSRIPNSEPLGNPLDRQALCNQRLELRTTDAALRPVTHTICLQSMLLDPVTDGRGMFSGELSDRLQRHPFGQAFLQEPPLHGGMLAGRSDRKMRRVSLPIRRRRARCGLCVRPGRRVRG